jgi:hypothetical protein
MSQILFGTAYPYRGSLETAEELKTSAVFGSNELRAIDRRNALKLCLVLPVKRRQQIARRS